MVDPGKTQYMGKFNECIISSKCNYIHGLTIDQSCDAYKNCGTQVDAYYRKYGVGGCVTVKSLMTKPDCVPRCSKGGICKCDKT
ncbi:hypothetical protein BG005_002808, partial [Podila minutissima]